MEKENKEQTKKMAKMIARAWSDDSFKALLLSNPREALIEYDITIPTGIEVRVVEETDSVMYIVLPIRPGEEWLVKPTMNEDTDEIACARCV